MVVLCGTIEVCRVEVVAFYLPCARFVLFVGGAACFLINAI